MSSHFLVTGATGASWIKVSGYATTTGATTTGATAIGAAATGATTTGSELSFQSNMGAPSALSALLLTSICPVVVSNSILILPRYSDF